MQMIPLTSDFLKVTGFVMISGKPEDRSTEAGHGIVQQAVGLFAAILRQVACDQHGIGLKRKRIQLRQNGMHTVVRGYAQQLTTDIPEEMGIGHLHDAQCLGGCQLEHVGLSVNFSGLRLYTRRLSKPRTETHHISEYTGQYTKKVPARASMARLDTLI